MPCQCEQCSDTPAPTWTMKHRLKCEAKMLYGKSVIEQRNYLAKIQEKRGFEAKRELEKEMDKYRERINECKNQ